MLRPAEASPGEQLNHVITVTFSGSCPSSVFIDDKKHLFILTEIILDDTAVGMRVENHSPKTAQTDKRFEKF